MADLTAVAALSALLFSSSVLFRVTLTSSRMCWGIAWKAMLGGLEKKTCVAYLRRKWFDGTIGVHIGLNVGAAVHWSKMFM